MIPLIIVSDNENEVSNFIKKIIVKNHIHPGYIYNISPVNNEISINQIRQLKQELTTLQPRKRLIIFHSFEKSSLEAQNSLLKLLEEAVANNLFLMTVNNSEKIIPTILSRSQIVKLDNLKNIELNQKKINLLLKTIKNEPSLKFLSYEYIYPVSREELIKILHQAVVFYRKELFCYPERSKQLIIILKKIFKLLTLVENNNLNPQLVIDNLLIFIWKKYKNIFTY